MTKQLQGNDRIYGWTYGEDGFVNATEGAEILGMSQAHLCRLLRELRDLSLKRPTDRTWPLRAGKVECSDSPTDQWYICKRSLLEYAKRRQPVEV
jgi:hypothetical protein